METIDKATPFKYRKAMIVDDSGLDVYVCDRLSKAFHFSEVVIGHESPEDALEYLIAFKDKPAELPEIIFLDIDMPLMNGFEFMDAFQQLPDTIKNTCTVVLLTSSLHVEDSERARDIEYVRAFLSKPLSGEMLGRL